MKEYIREFKDLCTLMGWAIFSDEKLNRYVYYVDMGLQSRYAIEKVKQEYS